MYVYVHFVYSEGLQLKIVIPLASFVPVSNKDLYFCVVICQSFYVQLFELYLIFWWNCWPSLFKLSFQYIFLYLIRGKFNLGIPTSVFETRHIISKSLNLNLKAHIYKNILWHCVQGTWLYIQACPSCLYQFKLDFDKSEK